MSVACIERAPETTTEGSTTEASSTSSGATTEAPTEATTAVTTGNTTGNTTGDTAETTISKDPDYVRECQDGDFKCGDWGCEPDTELGQCYKRCSPASSDDVGLPHADCDEPERPFCSQVGLALGGDYDCNDCAFICTAVAVHRCEPDFACQG